MPGASRAITRIEHEGPAFRLQNLSVELDDGTVVVKDADVLIEPGERVLLVGESGNGKDHAHARDCRPVAVGAGQHRHSAAAPRWS